jgi:hypothetical protein
MVQPARALEGREWGWREREPQSHSQTRTGETVQRGCKLLMGQPVRALGGWGGRRGGAVGGGWGLRQSSVGCRLLMDSRHALMSGSRLGLVVGTFGACLFGDFKIS